jgi:hypothetical protein
LCERFVGYQVNFSRPKKTSLWSQATALLHSLNAPVHGEILTHPKN